MALNEWQYWGDATDEELADTPVEIKREWGERFRKLSAGMERQYMLYGPANIFESVCRLVRDRKIQLRCMLTMPISNQYVWRVEFRLTQQGSDYIRVRAN